MNIKLRKKVKNNFEKDFFKLMNIASFGRKCEKTIKFVTTERRRHYLISESNYHTTKFFTEKLLPIEIKKNSNTYA